MLSGAAPAESQTHPEEEGQAKTVGDGWARGWWTNEAREQMTKAERNKEKKELKVCQAMISTKKVHDG